MSKFKVGDEVRALCDSLYKGIKKGETGIVKGLDYECEGGIRRIRVVPIDGHKDGLFLAEELELTEPKLTKNQRITALEDTVAKQGEEIAELKVIVHRLRTPSEQVVAATSSIMEGTTEIIEFEGAKYRKVEREKYEEVPRLAREGDVVIFRDNTSNCVTNNKPFLVETHNNDIAIDMGDKDYCTVYYEHFNRTPETVDVYELIKESELPFDDLEDLPYEPTPNQLRAEVIEKAKVFVLDKKQKRRASGEMIEVYINRKTSRWVNAEFIVNEEKRTVVCLIRWTKDNLLEGKGIAKCMPNDVFNEHIGKAIALGRALGLDVSEFEQAVQPSEVVVGTVFERERYEGAYTEDFIRTAKELTPSGNILTHEVGGYTQPKYVKKIINDTNAQYGGVE